MKIQPPIISKITQFYKLLSFKTLVKKKITKSKNPYNLIWYKEGWSKTRTEKNNTKYWLWEMEFNGFKP